MNNNSYMKLGLTVQQQQQHQQQQLYQIFCSQIYWNCSVQWTQKLSWTCTTAALSYVIVFDLSTHWLTFSFSFLVTHIFSSLLACFLIHYQAATTITSKQEIYEVHKIKYLDCVGKGEITQQVIYQCSTPSQLVWLSQGSSAGNRAFWNISS